MATYSSSSINYHQVFFIPNRIDPSGENITGSGYSPIGEPHYTNVTTDPMGLNNVVFGTFNYTQGEST